jgi:hypothetical protein
VHQDNLRLHEELLSIARSSAQHVKDNTNPEYVKQMYTVADHETPYYHRVGGLVYGKGQESAGNSGASK